MLFIQYAKSYLTGIEFGGSSRLSRESGEIRVEIGMHDFEATRQVVDIVSPLRHAVGVAMAGWYPKQEDYREHENVQKGLRSACVPVR